MFMFAMPIANLIVFLTWQSAGLVQIFWLTSHYGKYRVKWWNIDPSPYLFSRFFAKLIYLYPLPDLGNLLKLICIYPADILKSRYQPDADMNDLGMNLIQIFIFLVAFEYGFNIVFSKFLTFDISTTHQVWK
jgi:hypothetical protein